MKQRITEAPEKSHRDGRQQRSPGAVGLEADGVLGRVQDDGLRPIFFVVGLPARSSPAVHTLRHVRAETGGSRCRVQEKRHPRQVRTRGSVVAAINVGRFGWMPAKRCRRVRPAATRLTGKRRARLQLLSSEGASASNGPSLGREAQELRGYLPEVGSTCRQQPQLGLSEPSQRMGTPATAPHVVRVRTAPRTPCPGLVAVVRVLGRRGRRSPEAAKLFWRPSSSLAITSFFSSLAALASSSAMRTSFGARPGMRPGRVVASPSLPRRRSCLRHFDRCELYRPSRRNSTSSWPDSVHWSACSTIASL
jgi:hypothetical protein